MKEKISCLLIDPDRDRRNQFFMALDLLGNSKACICQDSVESALNYLKEQVGFSPDFIFMDAEANQSTLLPVFPAALKNQLPKTTIVWYSGSYHASAEIALKKAGWATGLTKLSNLLQLKAALKSLLEQDFTVAKPDTKPVLRLVKYEPAYQAVNP